VALAVVGGSAASAVILTSGGSAPTDSTRTNGAPRVSCLPPAAPNPTVSLLIAPNPTAIPALPSLQVAVDALQCNGKPLSSTAVTLAASGGSFSPGTKLPTSCSQQQCTLTTNAAGLANVVLLVTEPPNVSPTLCTPEDVTGSPNACLQTILRANVSVTAKVMNTIATAGPELIQASTITNQGAVPNDTVQEPVAFTIGYPPGTAPPQNPAWLKEISCQDYNAINNLVVPAAECVASMAILGCLAAGASGVGVPVALACASSASFVAETFGPDCLSALLGGVLQYLGVGQAAPPPSDLGGYLKQLPTVWCSVLTATSLQITPTGDKVFITAEDDAESSVAGTPVYLATAGPLGGVATVSGSTGCYQPASGVPPPPCPSTVSASGVGFVTGTSGLTITYTAPASPPSGESEDLLASLSVLNNTSSSTPTCPSGPQKVTGINAVGCTPLWPAPTSTPTSAAAPCTTDALWGALVAQESQGNPGDLLTTPGQTPAGMTAYCGDGWAELNGFPTNAGSGSGLALLQLDATGWKFVTFDRETDGGGPGFDPCAQYPDAAVDALGTHLCAIPVNTPPTGQACQSTVGTPSISLFPASDSGLTVTINGVIIIAPGISLAAIDWFWGDGTLLQGCQYFPSSHTYSQAGSYLVVVTGVEANGQELQASEQVTISG